MITFSNNARVCMLTDNPEELAADVCNQWFVHSGKRLTVKSIVNQETPHAGDFECADQTTCSDNSTKSQKKSLDDLKQEIRHEMTTYETRHGQNA